MVVVRRGLFLLVLVVLVVVIVEMSTVLRGNKRLRTKQTRLSQQRQDGKESKQVEIDTIRIRFDGRQKIQKYEMR